MSACGQSGHGEEDSASEEVNGQLRDKTSDIYKQKPVSKVVRVLTVLAYLLSVSLAAILLSVYYVCVWKSPELPRSKPIELSFRRGNRSDYGDFDHAVTPFSVNGGGDTTVNNSTTPLLEIITSGYPNVTESNSTSEAIQDTATTADYTPQKIRNKISNDTASFNNTDNVT